MASRKKKKSQKKTLITIGTLIILLSMVFVSYITYIQMKTNVDKNAIKENDDGEDKMDVTPGGGSASLEYSNIVEIDKNNQKISLYIKNKNKSRENISIELYLEDKLIADSQIIPTGYSIKELDLKIPNINEGEYKGYIKVFFYNEDTNNKEIVDSKIKVDIKVK